MLAYEAQDKKQILKAILDTIDACSLTDEGSDIEVNKLTTYDVDYIFTKIRAKSVGEKADLRVACSECEDPNDVSVDLDAIEIKNNNEDSIVKINDEISVKLRHPTYQYFMDKDAFFKEDRSNTEILMDLIVSCLDSVMTEDEVIKISDEPIEEVTAFLDSLSANQFEKITNYVENMPSMETDISFVCTSCGTENNRKLKGLDDFF